MVCGNGLGRLHNKMLPREHSDNKEHSHSYIVGGARVSGGPPSPSSWVVNIMAEEL